MQRIFLLLFLIPVFCFSQIPKPKPNTYVNDYTHTLAAEEITQLNKRLRLLEDKTRVQVAIVLINELPQDVTIEEYARDIGNTWKVGTNHNGIIFVAVLKSHKQRLEVAERSEGDITDVAAKEILDNLQVLLRQKAYYTALHLLITQISERLIPNTSSPDTAAQTPLQLTQNSAASNEQSEFERDKAKWNSYRPYETAAIIGGAVCFLIWAYRYKKKYRAKNIVNGVYIGIGSEYYASTHPEQSSSDDGSKSGDFGSDGGGGFSGGGASGDW